MRSAIERHPMLGPIFGTCPGARYRAESQFERDCIAQWSDEQLSELHKRLNGIVCHHTAVTLQPPNFPRIPVDDNVHVIFERIA